MSRGSQASIPIIDIVCFFGSNTKPSTPGKRKAKGNYNIMHIT